MADEVRILIADDHPVVRKGLRMSIQESDGLQVVAEASDGESALALIQELSPDVAVLDIDMPKLDGFGVVRAMAKQGLNTATIFLTLHSEEEFFREALETGAKGYLLKDSAMDEIGTAIRAVIAGQPYLSSAITARLLQRREEPAPAPAANVDLPMTPTERRIMKLIGEGLSSKEIGAALNIHYRTVENHRTNICRKFGIEGSNALLRFTILNKDRL